MHHVRLVEKDTEGNEQAGIHFWHVPGSDTYLYQTWEHRASGREYGQTLPDPVVADPKGGSDLLYTVQHCWAEQSDMEFSNPNYPVDTDYR